MSLPIAGPLCLGELLLGVFFNVEEHCAGRVQEEFFNVEEHCAQDAQDVEEQCAPRRRRRLLLLFLASSQQLLTRRLLLARSRAVASAHRRGPQVNAALPFKTPFIISFKKKHWKPYLVYAGVVRGPKLNTVLPF